jgi:D-alanine--poly(phosphoribitol) ligase subunit 2
MKKADLNGVADFQHRIADLFLEKMQIEVPNADTDLFETGVLDSLRFVELLVYLEEEFATKCSVEDLEIDHFRSITKIAAFVESREAVSPAAPSLG